MLFPARNISFSDKAPVFRRRVSRKSFEKTREIEFGGKLKFRRDSSDVFFRIGQKRRRTGEQLFLKIFFRRHAECHMKRPCKMSFGTVHEFRQIGDSKRCTDPFSYVIQYRLERFRLLAFEEIFSRPVHCAYAQGERLTFRQHAIYIPQGENAFCLLRKHRIVNDLTETMPGKHIKSGE